MNLVNYPHKTSSISQFEQARCYELVGKEYLLIMDGGYDYELEFISKEECHWNIVGQGASRMVLLQDYDQMIFVGCLNSPVANENAMVAGYGLAPETINI